MCTVPLPPGGYPIAVNKYITSFVYTVHNQNAELYKMTAENIATNRCKRAAGRNRISLHLPVTWQAVAATKEDKGCSETQKSIPFIIKRLSQKAMSVQLSLQNRGGHTRGKCRGSRIRGYKCIWVLGSCGQRFIYRYINCKR